MTFWDTSAFVALVASEENSDWCRSQFELGNTYVSPTLPVESASALARLKRMGVLTEREAYSGQRALESLWQRTTILPFNSETTGLAIELLYSHGLKAGDAIQLASWLQLTRSSEFRIRFVGFDDRLNQAVIAEGGVVMPYAEP